MGPVLRVGDRVVAATGGLRRAAALVAAARMMAARVATVTLARPMTGEPSPNRKMTASALIGLCIRNGGSCNLRATRVQATDTLEAGLQAGGLDSLLPRSPCMGLPPR